MKRRKQLKKALARWLHPWHWPCVKSGSVQWDAHKNAAATIEIDTTRTMGLAGRTLTLEADYDALTTACRALTYAPLERLIPYLATCNVIPVKADEVPGLVRGLAVQLPGDGLQRHERIAQFLATLMQQHAGWMSFWVPDDHVHEDDVEPHLRFSIWGDHNPKSTVIGKPPRAITVAVNALTDDMDATDEWIEAIKASPESGFYRYVASRPYRESLDVAAETFAQRCVETMTNKALWDGLKMPPHAQEYVRSILEEHKPNP